MADSHAEAVSELGLVRSGHCGRAAAPATMRRRSADRRRSKGVGAMSIVLFRGRRIRPILSALVLGAMLASIGQAPASAAPLPNPPVRNGQAMAYSGGGRVMLFGGSGDAGRLDDTWEWNGAWAQRAVAVASPPARQNHALAPYDGAVGKVLLDVAD